ncbi:MAG: hypothetical protein HY592_02040 [Candidatus Omnitrophica bacterium]|nr:hypothetical protein [Candidatus Omnitrophota bacterium]
MEKTAASKNIAVGLITVTIASLLAFSFLLYRRSASLEKQVVLLDTQYRTAEGIVKEMKSKQLSERTSEQQAESGYKADYLRVLAEKNVLESERISMKAEIDSLASANQKMTEDRSTFQAQMGEKEKVIGQLQAKADQLKAANEKADLFQTKNKKLTEDVGALKTEVAQRAKVLQEANADLKSKAIEISKKNAEIIDLRKSNRTAWEMKRKIEKQGAEIVRRKDKEEVDRRTIDELARKLKEGESARKELLKNIEVLKKEKEEFKRREKIIASEDSRRLMVSLKAANKKVEELEARNAVAHYNIGVLYVRMAQHKDAAEEFENAVRLSPKDALAHFNLAVLYDAHLSKPKLALPHYEAYIRLLPHATDKQEIQNRVLQMRLDEEAGVGRDLRLSAKS